MTTASQRDDLNRRGPPPPDAADIRDADILRVGLASIWGITALLVFHPAYREVGESYLAPLSLPGEVMWATCAAELALAIYLLVRRPGIWITLLQLVLVLGFTAILTLVEPMLWAHPLGVLSKNAPILGAIVAAYGLRYRPLQETARILLWLGVAFVWFNEGLMPKILFPTQLEIGWIEQVGLSPVPAPTALWMIGAVEIGIAVVLVAPAVPPTLRRGVLALCVVLVVVLPIPVVLLSAEFVTHPFQPLGKNLPLIAAMVVLFRQAGRGFAPLVEPFVYRVPATGDAKFSRVSSRWGAVGADIFHRLGWDQGAAAGLVERFADLGCADFDVSSVDDRLSRFYEQTASYTMSSTGGWSWPFSVVAPWFRSLYGRRVGQFGLPLASDPPGPMVTSVRALDSAADGRRDVRAWIRTRPDLGLTVYAAAYALVEIEGRPCMSVAFVQPFGSLTTVLAAENMGNGGLRLSTCSRFAAAGNFLVFVGRSERGLAIKVPFLHEQLSFEVTDDGTMRADHWLWLLGVPYLRMSYVVEDKNEG